MDLVLALGITLLIGIVLGAIGVHYIHKVASAVPHVVPIPGVSVASVPAPVTGVLSDVQARIAALEAKLTTAAPKV